MIWEGEGEAQVSWPVPPFHKSLRWNHNPVHGPKIHSKSLLHFSRVSKKLLKSKLQSTFIFVVVILHRPIPLVPKDFFLFAMLGCSHTISFIPFSFNTYFTHQTSVCGFVCLRTCVRIGQFCIWTSLDMSSGSVRLFFLSCLYPDWVTCEKVKYPDRCKIKVCNW